MGRGAGRAPGCGVTPPCPAPPGHVWQPHVFALVGPGGLRLVVARDGGGWTLFDADGTVLRDGVTAERLAALVGADVPDPTADRAQVRALGER